MSPYGVAAGECIAHPPPHIAERRQGLCTKEEKGGNARSQHPDPATAAAAAVADEAPAREPPQLGGRVFRLTKFAEKPTAEYARENLVTEGLGRGDGGEGRHLVVFGQASQVSPVVSCLYRGRLEHRSTVAHPSVYLLPAGPSFLVATRGNRLSWPSSPPLTPPPPPPSSPPSRVRQYVLPARRTFDILAEDIRLDRRERWVGVRVREKTWCLVA